LESAQVDANEPSWFKVMGAFFKRFSGASLDGRLPRVEVPGWVVQPQSFWGVLLNQQKLAIFFNDGCNGDAGLPTC